MGHQVAHSTLLDEASLRQAIKMLAEKDLMSSDDEVSCRH